jgi:hypothetical protein
VPVGQHDPHATVDWGLVFVATRSGPREWWSRARLLTAVDPALRPGLPSVSYVVRSPCGSAGLEIPQSKNGGRLGPPLLGRSGLG